MAFPPVDSVTASSQSPNATSITVSFPTASAGDLILVLVASDAASGAHSAPAGWVELKDEGVSTTAWAAVYYLIAAGGESSVVISHTTERSNALAVRILAANWHGTTPPEISAAATGSSAAPNSPSLTPSWGSADTLWLSVVMADDNPGGFPVTAWPYPDNQTSASTATSAGAVAVSTSGIAAASEDPGAYTLTAAEQWNAYTIAVRPAAAAGTTVTPDAASLAITGFAPTVSVSNNKVVTPAAASLAITGFAPTVTASNHKVVVPAAASLSITGFAPTVNIGVTVTPAAASLAVTGFAPTVTATQHKVVTPAAASLAVTGFAPTVTASNQKVVTPAAASLAVTGFAPTVTASDRKVVTPAAVVVTVTGFAPDVLISLGDISVEPDAVFLTLTGFAPTVTVEEPAPIRVHRRVLYGDYEDIWGDLPAAGSY